ncbi:hypothetical protein A2U01_0101662, partial [Trifolium medium]|nr:hypothetical protein [Trifolium medium]
TEQAGTWTQQRVAQITGGPMDLREALIPC